MQKKLITDQLIEEYQKELDETYEKEGKDFYSHKALSVKRKQLRIFITRLQSLRQQEVQNVMTAFYDGTINESNCGKEYYFTSIFQQEKGEEKK